ncbi:macrolide family glycosyltransferase [Paenibacillus polymyxa]|uniref:UDP-glucosyltransferase n=1 Tax=Paenibacillus polymyxa (strain SC2) TaxID=886882 RepID=E3EBH3_PAEPS|nr:macrolide family glycosyltransferase [Paenibacillus polymyxa]ADO58647.1 UDP-glucosyltransferase [Paenibacillus polymyxa SC2]QXF28300.1 glycosyltransferase [Paenibacillus polymyxa]WPQ56278.1 macrolide family glycosyltransferase [Paenibacillus polymyxa]CCI71197.1 UDP-glucuronosyltransferase 2B7 UDPGT [Paenibacillus polymyxa M1]
MLNVLMVNFPAEGHVNPTLGITQAFAARGDQVHYITTEKYKNRLEAVGAKVHLHPDLVRTASIDTSTPAGLNAFMNIHIQTSMDILAIIQELSERIQFDLVFYDRFGAGELVRDYLNIPGISSSPSFLISNHLMAANLFRSDAKVPFQPDEQVTTSLHLMKERFGVAPKEMVQFMNNSGALNVVYTSKYFQPNGEQFGDEHLFIGPSFPERKGENSFPLDRLQDKKVLYISMGTVLDHTEDFFNTCIEAFSDFEGIVVIAAGEKADFTKINPAPEHFIISPYVPQLEVLRHSDVFITHGGMNSVNEGIHFNVPLVVLPQDKDQPMVAQRLTELQAGYRITKDQINTQTLRDGVHEVMSNAAYKEGVQKINDSFQQSGGTKEALAKIDAYLDAYLQHKRA